jgi:hypothetical protein
MRRNISEREEIWKKEKNDHKKYDQDFAAISAPFETRNSTIG